MTEYYFPAISTFEAMPEELPAVGIGAGASRADDLVQLHVAPSGVSVKGRSFFPMSFGLRIKRIVSCPSSMKTESAVALISGRAIDTWPHA